MLVGEAPGASEEKTGRPFVGKAGEVLDTVLREAGLTRDDVYISNIVKCRPPGNRDPLPDEVARCLPYLAEEVDTIKPDYIVAMGLQALGAMTGLTGMKRARGRILTPRHPLNFGNAKLTATWHPAFYLRGKPPMILSQMVDDLRFVANQIRGTTLPEHKKLLATTPMEVTNGLERLKHCPFVAVDLEWTAIYDEDSDDIAWPWTPGAELYSISISGKVDDLILSVAMPYPTGATTADAVLSHFLANHRAIFHHAMADIVWLNAAGLPTRLAGDTKILAYLMDERQPLKLSQLALTYLGIKDWKRDLWSERPRRIETWLEMLSYNADDTYATLLLHDALVAKLKERDTVEQANIKQMYTKLMLPSTATFASAALEGVPFDQERLEGALSFEHNRLDALTAQLGVLAGVAPHSAKAIAMSPVQSRDYLHDVYGLNIDSSDKNALAPYVSTHESVKLIQDIRNSNKLISTYLQPYVNLLNKQGDGRIHSIINLCASDTGRTAADQEEGGSLQVWPHDPWARKCIVAPPGWKIMSSDEGQAELRIAAVFAQEQTMLRILNDPANDIHRSTAAMVAGIPESEVTKIQRQAAKAINFGFTFGMGPEKFQIYAARPPYSVHFTLDEARNTRDAFFAAYPGLKSWHAHCNSQFRRHEIQVTPLGRYRRYFATLAEFINFRVQSTSSDIVLIAINSMNVEFRKRGMRSRVLFFIHDNVIALVPDDEVTLAAQIMRYHMEHPNTAKFGWSEIGVLLSSEVTVGQSWGTATTIDVPELVPV